MSKNRLGKREREAKRALIKGNLANLSQLERSSGTLHSSLTGVHKGTQYSRLEANAHTLGCHVGSSEGRMGPRGSNATNRFSGGPKHCDTARTILVLDEASQRKVPQKQIWLEAERYWKKA